MLVDSPAHAAGGTLQGTLTWPDGQPVDYFQVDVYQASGVDAWQLAKQQTFAGDPVGELSLTLPAGTYRACFSKLGFGDDVGTRCWSDGDDVFDGTDIVIAEGGTTSIDPRLPPDAELRGRIVGADGAGVSAYVAPYRRLPDGTWQHQGGQQSISDGTFVVPRFDPGTYRLCLLDAPREYLPECWDDVAAPADADEVALAPDGVARVRFRLVRRANISGTVTSPPGSTGPLGVVASWWRNGRWEPVAFASAGVDETYRITGLDADTYRVCANGFDIVRTCWRNGSQPADATDIVLATGRYRRNVDVSPTEAGYVSGTLPDVYLGAEGYPAPTAYRLVGGEWVGVSSGDAVPVGIGNDWTYEIGSLPTGTYVVCVHHEEPEFVTAFPRTCTGGSPSPEGAVPFEVVAGATTSGIDIATASGSTAPPRGRPSPRSGGSTRATRPVSPARRR